MIFPGMDPYLENASVWPGVHNSLIVYIRDHLQKQLRPRYIASIEARVYLEQPEAREFVPDVLVRPGRFRPSGGGAAVLEEDTPITLDVPAVEVNESFIQILDTTTGNRVVTVLEVVSPTNKYAGDGRDLYLAKRREVRRSTAHLVEIDLLRYGPHVLAVPEVESRMRCPPYDYLVCVNRAAGTRSRFELYPRPLRQRLPRVRIPLADPDPDAVLELQAVIEQTYEAGSYRDLLPYGKPCEPTLKPEDQAWADQLIRAATEVTA